MVKYYKSKKSLRKKNTKHGFEVVTNVDTIIEGLIRKLIKDTFPKHNIIGEEKGFLKISQIHLDY